MKFQIKVKNVKTFRRRVRSASRRVGGSNCDLKSNLSSFFTVQFATVYASAFMHSKSVETFSNEKKNSFLFVLSLPSLFAFIIRLEITYAKFCLNINQLSRKFFSCNSRFSRLEIVADFYFVYFFSIKICLVMNTLVLPGKMQLSEN